MIPPCLVVSGARGVNQPIDGGVRRFDPNPRVSNRLRLTVSAGHETPEALDGDEGCLLSPLPCSVFPATAGWGSSVRKERFGEQADGKGVREHKGWSALQKRGEKPLDGFVAFTKRHVPAEVAK